MYVFTIVVRLNPVSIYFCWYLHISSVGLCILRKYLQNDLMNFLIATVHFAIQFSASCPSHPLPYIYMHTHTDLCICTYTYMYPCINMYMYMCMHTCIYLVTLEALCISLVDLISLFPGIVTFLELASVILDCFFL